MVANKPGTAVITVKTADGGYTAKCIVKVSGYKPFEKKYAERLKSEFIDLLGNKKIDIPPLNLFYVNTTEKCIETLLYYDDVITNTANEIGLHKAIIQTILLRELWCINLADIAGDELVENFYKWKDDCEYWESQDESYQASVQYPEKPLLVKSDSSVGLGQIFASTAISANNHAVQSGYICSTWLNPNDWHICKNMWYALRDNDEYNIRMSSLNILSCVDEFGYEHNYNDFTGNQCKLVFSRYNAKTDTIIDYGEECYQYFLIFNKYI